MWFMSPPESWGLGMRVGVYIPDAWGYIAEISAKLAANRSWPMMATR